MSCIIFNIFTKRIAIIDTLPPTYSVYARENDDNSGRPISCVNIKDMKKSVDPTDLVPR